jgi:hypothetical protein
MKLVVEGSSRVASPDQSLITAVVRAWDWADRLISGEVETMAEICAEEGFTDSYVGQVPQLAFLPPQTVEGILAGTHEPALTANSLICRRATPYLW